MVYVVFIALLSLCVPGVTAAFLLWTTPKTDDMAKCLTTKMYHVFLCPWSDHYVRLEDISDIAKNAVLVSEDASFYSHNGFDWFELRSSLMLNLEEGGFVRGGSTISQQLAKNLYLSGRKTLGRKLQEAYITYKLENKLSKNQIFERYLNVVEFGPKIYGIKDAALHYFDKLPSELNVLEGAFLAYLLPNPKGYSRVYDKRQLTPFARKRVIDICYRLMRFRRITQPQYEAAKALVDRFPWMALTDEERALLGESLSTFDSPIELLEDLPEEDATQPQVPDAPPPEPESELELEN